jgi:hypothetical protein
MIFDLQSFGPLELEEAGIFTWNVSADVMFGDSAVALLHGLPAESTISGQKMCAYLGRIHPDDLADVALAIHTAITSCGSYHATYRVRGALDIYRPVESWGRCFRGSERDQVQFAGIIYPAEPMPRVGSAELSGRRRLLSG